MGWYHHEYTNSGSSSDPSAGPSASCPDGTCSLPSPDLTREAAAQEEIYTDIKGPVYHLCQRDNWLKAIDSKEAYFPPTFWSDGRFTRGSCARNTLLHTANTYYKSVAGDWLCLELDPAVLRRLGIPIAVHRAPEAAADGQPAQCLKLYGGISVTTLGLVLESYALQRGADGSFLAMLPDDGMPRMARNNENKMARPSTATTDAPEHAMASLPVVAGTTRPQKRGFWQRSMQLKK